MLKLNENQMRILEKDINNAAMLFNTQNQNDRREGLMFVMKLPNYFTLLTGKSPSEFHLAEAEREIARIKGKGNVEAIHEVIRRLFGEYEMVNE